MCTPFGVNFTLGVMSALRIFDAVIAFIAAHGAVASEFRFKSYPPVTEEGCRAKGGYWGVNGMPGSPRPAECNLRTTDAKRVCSTSEECEGYCLLDKEHSGWLRTVGRCSPEQKLIGCHDYLQDGKRIQVCTD